MIIKILLLLIVYYVYNYIPKETYDNFPNKQAHYQRLMNDFSLIFPNNNRNAGGVQFYNHIYSMRNTLTKEEFMLHHTFYCAVSGSPIDPSRDTIYNHIVVNHVDGRQFVGKYYRCCWPCLCDIMKYVLAEHHTIDIQGEDHEHMVLTINDPCQMEEDIPSEITAFQCENKQTENGIRTNTNRLIIGVLHDYELYDPNTHDSLVNPIYQQCKTRMNTLPENLQGGMGDIFVSIAILND